MMGGAAPGAADAVNIAPKKANWDLKRDVKGKLDQLERQTQIALRDLFRQEMQSRNRAGDAEAVAGAVARLDEAEDDVDMA